MAVNFSNLSRGGMVGRLARLPLRLIPKGATLPVMQGPLKGARWIAGSHVHGCWLGSYEMEKQLAFGRDVKPADVVYDIGANVGFYTLLASRLVGTAGHVYAFEPLPRNLALLRKHVAINNLSNVTVLPQAVSDKPGEALFSTNADPAQNGLTDQGDIRVQVTAIDFLLDRGEIKPPKLMKIDVEGAEAMVLRGAAKAIATHHPTIYLATHNDDVHRECLQILRGHDYTLSSMDAEPLETTREVLCVHQSGR
jgi:FkbM family methyltransferase